MTEPIYRSPRGLHGFQAEGVARWYVQRSLFCTWETGCGKSHLSLAGGSLLVQDGLVGLVLLVCEQNKLKEWLDDFRTFTTLRAEVYMGTPKRREKIRASLTDGLLPPQVLITTYETSRNDLGGFVKEGRKKVFATGPLLDTLREVAARSGLAVVYDESTRLGNRYQSGGRLGGRWVGARGSVVYKAHEAMLKAVRSAAPDRVWVAGMTATPVETSPDNAFNQLRLIAPTFVGSIASFERDHVRYRDQFDRARYKNLGPDDPWREPGVVTFQEKIAPIVSHKSKSDPDIRAAFPEATEEPMYVTLGRDHAALYEAVRSLAHDEEVFPGGMSRTDEEVLFGVLRQVAAHPKALTLSPASSQEGTIASLIVNRVGAETLQGMKSEKEEALVAKLHSLVGDQGYQVVVFSFFGRSVIPILEERLKAEGFTVSTYTGSMTRAEKEKSKQDFKAGDSQIFLASDAAARGINLPEAKYVINYELCLTHAKTTQRINRLSRIDGGHDSITAFSMIALGTVEEAILGLNFRRQEWHEAITPSSDDGGEGVGSIGVEERRALFKKVKVGF